MRRPRVFCPIFSIGIIVLMSLEGALLAQVKPALEPEPSYREDRPAALRHPVVDTDVSLYIDLAVIDGWTVSTVGHEKYASCRSPDPTGRGDSADDDFWFSEVVMKILTCLAALSLAIGGLAVFSNVGPRSTPQLKEEPEPSFAEDATSNHRHPEVDTDVYLYINHWRNCLPYEGHGGLIERDILTPGDPLRPAERGAVLKYIKAYKRAALPPRSNTQPFRNDLEQVFFYIMSGTGRVEAGGKKAMLEEGTAVVVPAGIQCRFLNPAEEQLEMLLVVEGVTPGFAPNREISVGSYHDSQPSVGMHWAHIGRGFVYDLTPKFANPMGFAVVSIDQFDIAQPHVHGPGCEEVWCQLKGRSLLLFGNRLLWHEPGEAFLIPPNNKVPHASINHTGEHMLWLYMGNRHDRAK